MNATMFNVPFAIGLIGRTVNEVLNECVALSPELKTFTDHEQEYFNTQFDAGIGFGSYFQINGFEAWAIVGINCIHNKSVECIISLEEPVDADRFSDEYAVFQTITRSLEKKYGGGRVQQDDQEFGRVYLWEIDSILIGLSSYPEHGSSDPGVLLSVQIRDLRLHPDRNDLQLWYEEAVNNPIPEF